MSWAAPSSVEADRRNQVVTAALLAMERAGEGGADSIRFVPLIVVDGARQRIVIAGRAGVHRFRLTADEAGLLNDAIGRDPLYAVRSDVAERLLKARRMACYRHTDIVVRRGAIRLPDTATLRAQLAEA